MAEMKTRIWMQCLESRSTKYNDFPGILCERKGSDREPVPAKWNFQIESDKFDNVGMSNMSGTWLRVKTTCANAIPSSIWKILGLFIASHCPRVHKESWIPIYSCVRIYLGTDRLYFKNLKVWQFSLAGV